MHTYGLDLPDTCDRQEEPQGIVTALLLHTCIWLPQKVFRRCLEKSDGRTYSFFVAEGLLHEGQNVIIYTHDVNGKRLQKTGTVQRASERRKNKWFVQTVSRK